MVLDRQKIITSFIAIFFSVHIIAMKTFYEA